MSQPPDAEGLLGKAPGYPSGAGGAGAGTIASAATVPSNGYQDLDHGDEYANPEGDKTAANPPAGPTATIPAMAEQDEAKKRSESTNSCTKEPFLGYDRKSVTSIDGKKSIENLKLNNRRDSERGLASMPGGWSLLDVIFYSRGDFRPRT